MQYTTSVTPSDTNHASWWSANGRPATGTRALGTSLATVCRRVASPPARMTHCMDSRRSVADQDGGAVEVELEPRLGEAMLSHRGADAGWVLRVEHEEAPGASADELSADRAAGKPRVVPPVDVVV